MTTHPIMSSCCDVVSLVCSTLMSKLNISPAYANTGVGFGLVNLPAIVMVSTYFEERRAFAQGIAQAGAGIGTLLMAPVVNLLDDSLGWANTLAVIGGLVLLCVPLAAVFRPITEDGVCCGHKGSYDISQGEESRGNIVGEC